MRYVCYTSGPAELHTQSLLALRSIPPPAAPKQTRSRDTVSPEGHTRSKKAQAPQITTDPPVLGARYTPRPLQLQPAAVRTNPASCLFTFSSVAAPSPRFIAVAPPDGAAVLAHGGQVEQVDQGDAGAAPDGCRVRRHTRVSGWKHLRHITSDIFKGKLPVVGLYRFTVAGTD